MPGQRVTLILGGSQGDIQPFLYLTEALTGRGHSVRFCTHSMYRELAEASGAEYFSLSSGDPRQIMRDDYAKRKRLGKAAFVQRFFSAAEPDSDYLERMVAACDGANALLCNSSVGYATHIGEKLKIPTGLVHFAPYHPTRAFPPPVGPQNLGLPGAANFLSHFLLQEMYWLPNAPWINRWRVENLGLPALGRWRPPNGGSFQRFFAFSPALLPSIPDWPANNRMTGFWFGKSVPFDPPAELAAFFTGEPAIAVCFGSVMDARVGAVASHVIQAARELGFRVVVIGGWAIENLEPSPDVIFRPFVPYSWLFPKVQSVAHAGGCGTSAEVLRAGLPSVTVPFIGEQRFWAHRLWKSGASAPPLDWRTVTKEAVSSALIAARDSNAMRQAAVNLGEQLRAEDGVQRTIDLLFQERT